MTAPISSADMSPLEAALDLHRSGRLVDAVVAYRRILAFQPGAVEPLDLLGVASHQLGRSAHAIALLQRAVACAKSSASAHLNLALVQQAQPGAAAGRSFRRVLAQEPQVAKALLGLGTSAAVPTQALSFYRRAAAADPGYMEAHYNAADGLIASGDRRRGARALRRTLALTPALQRGHDALAMTTLPSDPETASRRIDRAIASAPPSPGVLSNAALVRRELGAFEQACRLLRRSICQDPSAPSALGNLGNALKDVGRAGAAQPYLARCVAIAPLTIHWNNLLLCKSYDPDTTREEFFGTVRRWARRLPLIAARSTPPRVRGDRISVAYLSADFRSHPVAWNIAPVFDRHDRTSFRIVGYTDAQPADAMTVRLQRRSDDWVRIDGMSDAEVATRIRTDEIDVLVILAGRIGANRLEVACHRAAPVQATMYDLDASGLPEIDCWLADEWLVRPDDPYADRVALLPCYAVHEAPEEAPEEILLAETSSGDVTFVSFNNTAKQGPTMYRLWAEILQRVPGSRLLLGFLNRYGSSSLRAEVLGAMAAAGVNPSRIEFETVARSGREHFMRLGRADIALDPAPFNGSTATFEALWMGLPVVSLTGPLAAGRMGASILRHVGLGHLVTETPDAYVAAAAALAADRAGRAELRRDLRRRLAASALMDAAGYMRALEGHYRRLVDQAEAARR